MMTYGTPIVFLLLIGISFGQEGFDLILKELNDWDYLMFSQRWPVTGCIAWEAKNKANTCNLPSDKTLWTIHGIWPTKKGSTGPSNCNSAMHFDPDQLQPILSELQQRWINVEANTKPNSFWAHEWTKHGTCAASAPALNSVFNYFNAGLELNKRFNISEMLAKANIYPNELEPYSVVKIFQAIESAVGWTPSVHCIQERGGKTYLSEIRICLNKDLEPMSCQIVSFRDGLHFWGGILTNCNLERPVYYYDAMPKGYDYEDQFEENSEILHFFKVQQSLTNLYKFVQLMIWATI